MLAAEEYSPAAVGASTATLHQQALHGRRFHRRRFHSRRFRAGASAVGTANGLVRYSGEVPLDQPGPFGYTVRVLPNHPLLDSRAELGLVTYPQVRAGMTNGDLR